jgi:hypothetical protein
LSKLAQCVNYEIAKISYLYVNFIFETSFKTDYFQFVKIKNNYFNYIATCREKFKKKWLTLSNASHLVFTLNIFRLKRLHPPQHGPVFGLSKCLCPILADQTELLAQPYRQVYP